MRRYDYERREIEYEDGSSADHYAVFDRFRGLNIEIASCDARDDAELIVAALNARAAKATAKPSNDNAGDTVQFMWDQINLARQARQAREDHVA